MEKEGTHYRKIDVRIWNDDKFLSLSQEAAMIFLFILTHPDLRPFGAMKSSMEALSSEFPFFDVKRFKDGYRELLDKGFIQASANRCFIRIKNFLKYNPPDNLNHLKSWFKAIDYLPECPERNELIQDFKPYAERYGIPLPDGYLKPIPIPMPNPLSTEQGTLNTEKIKNIGAKSKKNSSEKSSLPSWIPSDVWRDFEEFRKKIRKPLTSHARILAFKELEKLKTLGNDPVQVIQQSILNGWAGLFPLKGDRNVAGNGRPLTYAEIDERNQQEARRQFMLIGEDPADQDADHAGILDLGT